MDGFLILSTAIAFLSFLLLHILVFRFVAPATIMRWLVFVVLLGGIVDILVLGVLSTVNETGIPMGVLIILVSLLIYAEAVYIYVNIVIGIAVSSIRMQMLLTIAQAAKNGMSQYELETVYNQEIIIVNRLVRLVGSGELIVHGSSYAIRHRVSVYRLYGSIHLFICWLYGVNR